MMQGAELVGDEIESIPIEGHRKRMSQSRAREFESEQKRLGLQMRMA